MWRIRLFEERVGQLKRADEVHGLIHLSVGQEGVAAGVCTQLHPDDADLQRPPRPRARDRGGRAARAGDGRADGPRRRALQGAGRVDAPGRRRARADGRHRRRRRQHPDGARQRAGGAACAAATRWRSCSSATARCRRATSTSRSTSPTLWELPVIFVCENNGFAEFTPRSAHTRVERVTDVVAPYGLTRETVDGNDAVAVWETFGELPRLGARRARPAAAGVPDPPAARPLRGRPGSLPQGARGRGLAGEGPDPAAAAARGREGWFVDDDAAGSSATRRQAVERGGRVRAREPVPAGRRWSHDLTYAS